MTINELTHLPSNNVYRSGCFMPQMLRDTLRYASNSMATISLSGGGRTQSGLRKTRELNPSEGVHQC